jgi:hypothetical protein
MLEKAHARIGNLEVALVDQRIDAHEDLCTQRWGQILDRMSRVETIMLSVCGVLLLAMGGVVWAVLTKGHP